MERCGAASCCYSSMFLFAFCGEDQQYNRLKSIERLNLSRLQEGWKLFQVKRRTWIERAYHNATQLLTNGNLLIFGRYFNNHTSFEYKVTTKGTMSLVRFNEFPSPLSVYNLFKRGRYRVHCIDWVGADRKGWRYED